MRTGDNPSPSPTRAERLVARLGIKLLPREVREANAGEQQVSAVLRTACALTAAGMLAGAVWEGVHGASGGEASGYLVFALFLGYIAVFGLRRRRPARIGGS